MLYNALKKLQQQKAYLLSERSVLEKEKVIAEQSPALYIESLVNGVMSKPLKNIFTQKLKLQKKPI